ncbi:hypothetical protein TNCV_1748231 [Trichonephila clavipes]|nr:hypothetical protein TNCV_1748231 [Trichonephila clavipes]
MMLKDSSNQELLEMHEQVLQYLALRVPVLWEDGMKGNRSRLSSESPGNGLLKNVQVINFADCGCESIVSISASCCSRIVRNEEHHDAHSNGEMNNKMDDIEPSVDNEY